MQQNRRFTGFLPLFWRHIFFCGCAFPQHFIRDFIFLNFSVTILQKFLEIFCQKSGIGTDLWFDDILEKSRENLGNFLENSKKMENLQCCKRIQAMRLRSMDDLPFGSLIFWYKFCRENSRKMLAPPSKNGRDSKGKVESSESANITNWLLTFGA